MRKRHPRQDYQESKRQEKAEQESSSKYRSERKERARSFLPDPEVLENYNYVVEGSADRILAMVESEQKHRQQFELNQQKYVGYASYVGALCMVAICYIIVITYKELVSAKQEIYAVILLALGLIYMSITVVANFKKSSLKRDYRHRRPHENDSEE